MSLLAALFTSVGLLLILSQKHAARGWAGPISVFAAGMLLVSVFTHYLPEGLVQGEWAGMLCLGGFMFGLFLRAVPATASNSIANARGESRADVWAGILGIALHSFVDGGVYSLAFENGVPAGITATAPLVIHELAEGMIAFVLLSSVFSKRTAIIGTVLVAALTTPLGALVFGVVFNGVLPANIWMLQAFNAGLLVYLATVLLLRPLLQDDAKTSIIPLLLGVAMGLGLQAFSAHMSGGEAHGHAHHEGHNH